MPYMPTMAVSQAANASTSWSSSPMISPLNFRTINKQLMVRKFSEDIIGDDDHDVDAFAAWLTAIVGMYGVGPTRCDK